MIYFKDLSDFMWKVDLGFVVFSEFVDCYFLGVDYSDIMIVNGYNIV